MVRDNQLDGPMPYNWIAKKHFNYDNGTAIVW